MNVRVLGYFYKVTSIIKRSKVIGYNNNNNIYTDYKLY